MKFTYINISGNIAITDDVAKLPENLIKIDNTYFEKREEVKETKKVKQVIDVIIEEKLSEDLEAKAKEFLKDKKVRWFGLLKGQKIIDKAVELGFII